jgi:hypothetical protein
MKDDETHNVTDAHNVLIKNHSIIHYCTSSCHDIEVYKF